MRDAFVPEGVTVTLQDIQDAHVTLRSVVHHTPLNHSQGLSDSTGADVHLKLENLQRTGSFKVRGAYNRIHRLPEAVRAKGVVAASAGNHAQGVALAARLHGIPSTIVMPIGAPLSKAEAVRGYGAELIQYGIDYNEAEAKALEVQKQRGMTFVHAFNDPEVIAGQGTIGLEIAQDLPEADIVIVPVGGGGLIAGIATAMKALRPGVRIVGVEPEGASKLAPSLHKGELVTLERVGTIADGLATRRIGAVPFELARKHVDEVVTVPDDAIAASILYLIERAKTVVEGAGAVGLAALTSGLIKDVRGKEVCVLLSGGNIDVTLLDHILQRGLRQTGRTLELATVLKDKPGALRDLLTLLAELRANIESVEHDRARGDVGIGDASVVVKMDTRGPDHVQEILTALRARGYAVKDR